MSNQAKESNFLPPHHQNGLEEALEGGMHGFVLNVYYNGTKKENEDRQAKLQTEKMQHEKTLDGIVSKNANRDCKRSGGELDWGQPCNSFAAGTEFEMKKAEYTVTSTRLERITTLLGTLKSHQFYVCGKYCDDLWGRQLLVDQLKPLKEFLDKQKEHIEAGPEPRMPYHGTVVTLILKEMFTDAFKGSSDTILDEVLKDAGLLDYVASPSEDLSLEDMLLAEKEPPKLGKPLKIFTIQGSTSKYAFSKTGCYTDLKGFDEMDKFTCKYDGAEKCSKPITMLNYHYSDDALQGRGKDPNNEKFKGPVKNEELNELPSIKDHIKEKCSGIDYDPSKHGEEDFEDNFRPTFLSVNWWALGDVKQYVSLLNGINTTYV